jgi:hypothetical protein
MAVARARSAAPVERVAAQARIVGGGRRGARVRDKVRGRGQRVGGKVSIVGRVRGFARRARLEQARRQLGAEQAELAVQPRRQRRRRRRRGRRVRAARARALARGCQGGGGAAGGGGRHCCARHHALVKVPRKDAAQRGERGAAHGRRLRRRQRRTQLRHARRSAQRRLQRQLQRGNVGQRRAHGRARKGGGRRERLRFESSNADETWRERE